MPIKKSYKQISLLIARFGFIRYRFATEYVIFFLVSKMMMSSLRLTTSAVFPLRSMSLIISSDFASSKYHHSFGFVNPSLSDNGVWVPRFSLSVLIYIGVFSLSILFICSNVRNILFSLLSSPHAVITIATTAQKGGIMNREVSMWWSISNRWTTNRVYRLDRFRQFSSSAKLIFHSLLWRCEGFSSPHRTSNLLLLCGQSFSLLQHPSVVQLIAVICGS